MGSFDIIKLPLSTFLAAALLINLKAVAENRTRGRWVRSKSTMHCAKIILINLFDKQKKPVG